MSEPSPQLPRRVLLAVVALTLLLAAVASYVYGQDPQPTAAELARLREILGPVRPVPAPPSGQRSLDSKRRGVNYVTPPGTLARWRHAQTGAGPFSRPLRVDIHPWAPGTHYLAAGGVGATVEGFFRYLDRYGISREEFKIWNPVGEFGERNNTGECLGALCRAGLRGLGPPEEWDCEATAEEMVDAQVTNAAGTGIYAACVALGVGAPPVEKPVPPRPPKLPVPAPDPPSTPEPQPCAPQTFPDCEPCGDCAPAPPIIACPTPSPAVARALERLRAAADLSRQRRVTGGPAVALGPALAGYVKAVDEWVRANIYQPGLPSTGRLDVKVVPDGPNVIRRQTIEEALAEAPR
jgi:hypothetical protein